MRAQCFAKCILERAQLIDHPTGILPERLVQVGVLHGTDESTVRLKLVNCRPLYKSPLSCAVAWYLYVCLMQ